MSNDGWKKDVEMIKKEGGKKVYKSVIKNRYVAVKYQ